jgi:hypothetical protein
MNGVKGSPRMLSFLRRIFPRWFPRRAPRHTLAMACSLKAQAVAPGATLKITDYKPLARTRTLKPKLMACDPDPAVLDFISAIASPWYSVIGARDPGWAKAWLTQHPDIVACVAGEKLASAEGVDLLDRCRRQQPSMLRVLVTQNIEGTETVRALLGGVAHRLVESPMCQENLGMAIDPGQLRASVSVTNRRKLLAA